MTKKPMLEPCANNFRMKLETKNVWSARECLVGSNVSGSEQGSAGRQIKGIAMPVKHRYAAKPDKRIVCFALT